jgi:hypothetical protein
MVRRRMTAIGRNIIEPRECDGLLGLKNSIRPFDPTEISMSIRIKLGPCYHPRQANKKYGRQMIERLLRGSATSSSIPAKPELPCQLGQISLEYLNVGVPYSYYLPGFPNLTINSKNSADPILTTSD